MATKKKAKRVVRKVAAAVLERLVSPATLEQAKALADQARDEPHGETALKLRVQALELIVSELAKA